MAQIWLYSLVSVVLVSLISLVGVFFLSLNRKTLGRILLFLVSFAVGGLLGDAFIHLIPASFENLGINLSTSLLVITGIFVFFVLEKYIRWRHGHSPDEGQRPSVAPVVALNLIGDGVHNMIDGMLIGASYLVSLPLGLTTTFAVILHEIPQEVGDFGVLVHGGLSVRKALGFNFLSALTAILGAVISLLLGPHVANYSTSLLPIAAGGFIYIAASDLIPELHFEDRLSRSLWQLLFVVMGILVMVALVFLE